MPGMVEKQLLWGETDGVIERLDCNKQEGKGLLQVIETIDGANAGMACELVFVAVSARS